MADPYEGKSKGGLTPFAKILIGLIIIALVGFFGWKYLPVGGVAMSSRPLVDLFRHGPGPYFNKGCRPIPSRAICKITI
jgi:hypothetical protein